MRRPKAPTGPSPTVWKFDDPDAADDVRERVIALQKQELLEIHDAVVVTWPSDKKKPKGTQIASTTGAGAASGAFWGLPFGLIFFIPLFGLVFGAAMGAATAALADFGSTTTSSPPYATKVTPGTSARLLRSSDAVLDRVHAERTDIDAELMKTNLRLSSTRRPLPERARGHRSPWPLPHPEDDETVGCPRVASQRPWYLAHCEVPEGRTVIWTQESRVGRSAHTASSRLCSTGERNSDGRQAEHPDHLGG